MKKSLSVLLVLIFVFSVFTPALAADTDYTFSLTANGSDSARVKPGDTVTVELEVTKEDATDIDLFSMQDYIIFDTDYFSYVADSAQVMTDSSSGRETDVFTASLVNLTGTANRLFVNRASTSPLRTANPITVVTFELKALKNGTTTISHDTTEMLDGERKHFSIAETNATVVIKNKGGESPGEYEDEGQPVAEDPIPQAGPELTDISGHWAEELIKQAVDAGYVSGYPDGTFRPDSYVNRSEFVKMMVEAFHLTAAGGKTFMDTGDHWAKDYIAIAAANNLVLGVSRADGDYFLPEDLITREQAATILYRAANQLGITLSATAGEPRFADQEAVSEYAAAGVNALQRAGIINGIMQNGTVYFMPKDNATRAQAVKIIQGLLTLRAS